MPILGATASGHAVAPAPTFVKSAGNWTSSSGTTVSATFASSGVAAANSLLIAGVSCGTGGTLNTPAGWTAAVGPVSPSLGGKDAIFYKKAAGGETGLTATCTTSTTSFGIELIEVSGPTVWTLDKHPTPNDPGTTGTSLATGTTGALANASEVAFAFIGIGTGNVTGAPTWDSSFNSVFHGGFGNSNVLAGYLITSATTALNPTASWSGTAARVGLIATFYGS